MYSLDPDGDRDFMILLSTSKNVDSAAILCSDSATNHHPLSYPSPPHPIYCLLILLLPSWTGIAQTIQRLATGWSVRGSNSGGSEICLTRPDRPWGPSASYTRGAGSFPGVKWPERGTDHPPISSAEVKKRVELYFYSPSGPKCCVPVQCFSTFVRPRCGKFFFL